MKLYSCKIQTYNQLLGPIFGWLAIQLNWNATVSWLVFAFHQNSTIFFFLSPGRLISDSWWETGKYKLKSDWKAKHSLAGSSWHLECVTEEDPGAPHPKAQKHQTDIFNLRNWTQRLKDTVEYRRCGWDEYNAHSTSDGSQLFRFFFLNRAKAGVGLCHSQLDV